MRKPIASVKYTLQDILDLKISGSLSLTVRDALPKQAMMDLSKRPEWPKVAGRIDPFDPKRSLVEEHVGEVEVLFYDYEGIQG